MQRPLTVCYFGTYRRDYPRNRILINGLRQNGVTVLECNSRAPGLKKYRELLAVSRKLRGNIDALVVGFPGHRVMPLAWWIAKRAKVPVIFDAFTSLYHAVVFARKQVRPGSLRARYLRWWDWISCRLAAAVVVDTKGHAEYLSNLTKVKRQNIFSVFVGSDIADFPPQPMPPKLAGKFLVHFHGHYSPFQGVDVIIRAAKLLESEPVQFNLIGRGQEYKKVFVLAQELKVKNINFIDDVDFPTLHGYIKQSDLCLGVFGGGDSRPVIPNKIYEAIALGRPVLTAHLSVMDELFQSDVHIAYCRPDDPQDLAVQIRRLISDASLRQRLAANGQRLARERLTPAVLGRELAQVVKAVSSLESNKQ